MTKLALDKLRSLLSDYVSAYSETATTSEISQNFLSSHAWAVNAAKQSLEQIAIIKLINDVGKRRPSSKQSQMELFAGFSVDQSISLPQKFAGKRMRKPVSKVTIREAQTWVSAHSEIRNTLPGNVIEMQRLLDKLAPLSLDEDTTIEEALIIYRSEGISKIA